MVFDHHSSDPALHRPSSLLTYAYLATQLRRRDVGEPDSQVNSTKPPMHWHVAPCKRRVLCSTEPCATVPAMPAMRSSLPRRSISSAIATGAHRASRPANLLQKVPTGFVVGKAKQKAKRQHRDVQRSETDIVPAPVVQLPFGGPCMPSQSADDLWVNCFDREGGLANMEASSGRAEMFNETRSLVQRGTLELTVDERPCTAARASRGTERISGILASHCAAQYGSA
jgi:hypothetical protein